MGQPNPKGSRDVKCNKTDTKNCAHQKSYVKAKKLKSQELWKIKYPVELRFWIFPSLARYLARVDKSQITVALVNFGWNIDELLAYYFDVSYFSKQLGASIQTKHLKTDYSASWHFKMDINCQKYPIK